MKTITLFLLTTILFGGACNQPSNSREHVRESLHSHISYLANDDLEGRFTGSEGAHKAADYIKKQFEHLGLISPESVEGYFQPFDFTLRRYAAKGTYLHSRSDKFELNEDFYPLSYSSNDTITAPPVRVGFGIEAPELNYNDYSNPSDLRGKIFVIEVGAPDGIHPHSKYVEYHDLDTRIAIAKQKGAAGVLFVNSRDDAKDPSQKLSVKIKPMGIPVMFADHDALHQPLDDAAWTMAVNIKKEQTSGKNVVGKIDNDRQHTVVIGAHYDHLGYGIHNSLDASADSAIHNGADDNASGVAMMIQLARAISLTDSIDKYNYVFVAFSGEELGLYGSSHFVDEGIITPDSIHYMLNMDMVGRLDSSNTLVLNGTGTSPAFSKYDSLPIQGLRTKTSSSGIGPSDHAPFYLDNVPAIHFFTGTHSDYHKPTDDVDKINFDGMLTVYEYLVQFIGNLDNEPKLTFTKTDDSQNQNAPEFTVTLGVIPDYIYDGEGMKIDGIREGRTADNAGLKDGDVVIKMGPVNVKDMSNYMKALSYFKPGDTTNVTILRAKDTLNYQVIF